MLNEGGVCTNRGGLGKRNIAWDCREPACTSAEGQLLPVCREEASKTLGAWKSARVVTNHIALEVGFSKHTYQAQCMTVDHPDSGPEKFVHLKKNAPWFIAAVGGPSCKKSGLPSVHVIEALQETMYDKINKQVGEDAHRGRGEYGENEKGVTEYLTAEDDPMLLLG